MKVKISKKAIVFKITEEEAYALSKGEALQEDISIGGESLLMTISSVVMDGSDVQGLRIFWDKNEACLSLSVDQVWVDYLIDIGKNKDGLAVNTNGLDIVLQVDVKTDRRPFKKK